MPTEKESRKPVPHVHCVRPSPHQSIDDALQSRRVQELARAQEGAKTAGGLLDAVDAVLQARDAAKHSHDEALRGHLLKGHGLVPYQDVIAVHPAPSIELPQGVHVELPERAVKRVEGCGRSR
jgi:hypothetical protein